MKRNNNNFTDKIPVLKNRNYNFENKVVIITGASSGIGFEVAKNFLLYGANVVICSSNLNRIKRAYNKLIKIKKNKQKIFCLRVDVSSEKQVKKLIKFTIRKLKKIDILVNNAGIYGPKGFIEKVNWKSWIKTIQVNLFGSIMLCREIIPHFKKRNIGKIIQLSGGGAAAPLPRISGYAVSKVGIVRFVENLSEEVKDYNIDINSVAPGAINTKMLSEILKAGPKKIGNYAYRKALKQKRLGGSSYENACDLILFLGSSFSNGIRGKLISAIWDDWKNWPKYTSLLAKSDLFTLRRITSKDRGVKWGHRKKKNIYDRSLFPQNKLKK